MPQYLWDLTGTTWEIEFHDGLRLWMVEEPAECPFALVYARLGRGEPQHCALCQQIAEPAIFLRSKDGVKNREVGPFCIECVSSGPDWHQALHVPSAEEPEQEG